MKPGIDLIRSNKFMDGLHSATASEPISSHSPSFASSSLDTEVLGMISYRRSLPSASVGVQNYIENKR